MSYVPAPDPALSRTVRRRFFAFAALMAAAAVAVLLAYGRVMLFGVPPESAAAAPAAERGPILDRNGRILAIQTRLGNITVWRPEVADAAALAARLAPLLGQDAAELAGRINGSASDFLYAKKRVDQSTLASVAALRADPDAPLRGVGVEPVIGRVYPEKHLASQLVGFVGDDAAGLAGIEYAYQDELAPGSGRAYGDQVFLTIDANVQHILEGIAATAMADNKAEAVVMLAVEPHSGDVLGYVSLPDFDPNDIRASAEADRFDRPAVWAYEPGSVFKVFSIAALLELGAVSPDTTFTCNGKYERILPSGEKVTIKCLGAHGVVDAEKIIAYSCNAGAAYAADRAEAAAFDAAMRAFGFGAKTGTGLPGETAGFLRPVGRWSGRSKPTIAIGQELAVSALQMVQAATAIANDGVMVQPRVVLQVVSADGTIVRPAESVAPRQIVSAATARELRSYMAAAAEEGGTGRRANVEDLPLAVKTGTAQLIDPATNTYSDTDFVASCLALLPAEQPQLIIYTVIVKPKGDSYLGGRIAAPPVRAAAEALVDYLGIPRGRNPTAVHAGSILLPAPRELSVGATMPDFTGAAKRELLPLLSRDDLKVEIVGDGWVRAQSPAPGTAIEPGELLRFELE